MNADISSFDSVANAIRGYRFSYRAEDQLQEGVALALTAAGLPVEREVRLSPTDRIDFLIDHTGIEIKISGTLNAVLGQLQRYATSDLIDALVLVTTRTRHRALPLLVGGVPLHIIHIGGAA